jgi:hypothetical protein
MQLVAEIFSLQRLAGAYVCMSMLGDARYEARLTAIVTDLFRDILIFICNPKLGGPGWEGGSRTKIEFVGLP